MTELSFKDNYIADNSTAHDISQKAHTHSHGTLSWETLSPYIITACLSIFTGLAILLVKKHCLNQNHSMARNTSEVWVLDRDGDIISIISAFNLEASLSFTESDFDTITGQLGPDQHILDNDLA
jgi:hypothetical protein